MQLTPRGLTVIGSSCHLCFSEIWKLLSSAHITLKCCHFLLLLFQSQDKQFQVLTHMVGKRTQSQAAPLKPVFRDEWPHSALACGEGFLFSILLCFQPFSPVLSACTIKSVEFYLAKSLKKVASSSPKWQGFSKTPELYCGPISAHSLCEQSHSIFVLSVRVGLLKLF